MCSIPDPAGAYAQTSGRSEIFAGSDLEDYLRVLQLDGRASLYPWSIRSFSPSQVDDLLRPGAQHPWSRRYDLGPQKRRGSPWADFVRPQVTQIFNTTFPYGANDGPLWVGKGRTIAMQGGVALGYGPFSLTVAPTVFAAQNQRFELRENGKEGRLAYADGLIPSDIDRPQRFGDGTYGRVDPGQSTLRIDLPLMTIGASTANQFWGPATEHPIVLGNNAPGFPHAFLGTASPLDLGIARIHGRAMWGSLSQSDYTDITGSATRRFVSGLVGVIVPRGVNGLEIGAARLIHQAWPDSGLTLSNFSKPFETVIRANLPRTGPRGDQAGVDPDNQIASVFFRWAVPQGGIEVYGAYGWEDHFWDLDEFAQEPEHAGGYVLGFSKLLNASNESILALRAEVLNLQMPSQVQGRLDGLQFYRHSEARQGHTHRGQILGSPAGLGGGAFRLGLDQYHAGGRWSVFWSRELRGERGRYLQTNVVDPHGYDVQHALGAEALFFREGWDITTNLTGVYNFNRDFGGDAYNLSASVSFRSAGPDGRRDRASAAAQAAGEATNGFDGNADGDGARDRSTSTPRATAAESWQRSGWERARQIVPMVRSASRVVPRGTEPGTFEWSTVDPEIEIVSNSALPFSVNRGTMWAGRGRSARLSGGVRADWGKFFVIVAPEITHSQNLDFAMPDPRVVPLADQMSNPFANPWHVSPESIDLPIRFGDAPFTRIHPGQTTVGIETGLLTVGVSTENESWGPAKRNPIILSENAPGFPHLFIGTAKPIETPVGTLQLRTLLGALRESEFFDTVSANDSRSFSGLVGTFSPSPTAGLTLGFARAVYAPASGAIGVADNLFDALLSYPGRPNNRPLGDSTRTPGPDHLYSLFGRWQFPSVAFEVYGEWARMELPASLRDLLTAPGHTQGYTLGLEWAKPLRGNNDALRVQAEHTYLEESSTVRDRPIGTYYTSRAVPQGYTHAGRVLGAGIGPGSSSHWLALDYMRPTWQIGVFGERIRWENDALSSVPRTSLRRQKWCHHDVTLRGGFQLSFTGGFGTVSTALSRGTRMNLFFQNYTDCPRGWRNNTDYVDVQNTTLELKYSLR